MERRKFVIGAGALATGSAAALGTGAFSSVTAERSVEVEVADDADAYLALSSGNAELSDYVNETGDSIEILLDGSNVDGSGLNPDAVTTFDSLLNVANQGSQEVEVTVSLNGGAESYVTLETDGGTDFTSGVTIGRGVDEDINVDIDLTNQSAQGPFTVTATFSATATST